MAMPRDPSLRSGQASSGRSGPALGAALRRLLGGRRPTPQVLIAPGSAFEAVLEQRIASLEQRLDEVRSRVNGLIFLVLGTVLLQVVLRIAGF
ncbi:MAG: hypothetical protein HY688_04230 [Chloroflexi bacterium]|nr:hypothetical protein [Chloroflexota bacterium]